MGYWVNIIEGEVTIPKANLEEAYKRMCALNDNDAVKRGGQWGGEVSSESPRPEGMNYHPARWFSWMDANYPETCSDAKAILRELGFELEDRDGDLFIFGYDSKVGQEELFLDAISDLCTKDSFLVWRGEDGAMWRQEFGTKEMVVKTPVINWV